MERPVSESRCVINDSRICGDNDDDDDGGAAGTADEFEDVVVD